MIVKKSTKEQVENWKDKYDKKCAELDSLKKTNLLKIIFAILGLSVAFASSYLAFSMSDVSLENYKFTGNAMHVIGVLTIALPWLKMPFSIKPNT